MPTCQSLFFSFALLLVGAGAAAAADDAKLQLKPGDHISIIGNTLADRMQHDGWLEAVLQHRFPKASAGVSQLELSGGRDQSPAALREFRLARPVAHRGQDRRDLRLLRLQRVVCRRGRAGQLSPRSWPNSSTIRAGKNTTARRPRGWSCFRRSAHEDLHDPNLPDGTENNTRLLMYTEAMKQVAAEKGVVCVDLYCAELRPLRRARRR